MGAPAEIEDGLPPKRARTEDSTTSSEAATPPAPPTGNGLRLKTNGAAAVKPTETLVEAVAGKKRSKYWVYAVEPVAGARANPVGQDYVMSEAADMSLSNGHENGGRSATGESAGSRIRAEGSLSPTPSMDES